MMITDNTRLVFGASVSVESEDRDPIWSKDPGGAADDV